MPEFKEVKVDVAAVLGDDPEVSEDHTEEHPVRTPSAHRDTHSKRPPYIPVCRRCW